jgi:hypothetical protein
MGQICLSKKSPIIWAFSQDRYAETGVLTAASMVHVANLTQPGSDNLRAGVPCGTCSRRRVRWDRRRLRQSVGTPRRWYRGEGKEEGERGTFLLLLPPPSRPRRICVTSVHFRWHTRCSARAAAAAAAAAMAMERRRWVRRVLCFAAFTNHHRRTPPRHPRVRPLLRPKTKTRPSAAPSRSPRANHPNRSSVRGAAAFTAVPRSQPRPPPSAEAGAGAGAAEAGAGAAEAGAGAGMGAVEAGAGAGAAEAGAGATTVGNLTAVRLVRV